MRSSDSALLTDGFARLSEESRRSRFLSGKPTLSEAEVRRFTDVDHHHHEAIGALSLLDGRGVGIARYIRRADHPEAADVAVTVVDDWQGRGLGTALLRRLSERAGQEGIERFTALASADNEAVLGLMRSLGGARQTRRDSGSVEWEITLTPLVLEGGARSAVRAFPTAPRALKPIRDVLAALRRLRSKIESKQRCQ